MNVTIVLFILFIHWVADFLCQTDHQAQNKSKDNEALTQHILTYTAIWIVPSIILVGVVWASVFLAVTFICHWLTDYCTSRVNSKLWADKNVHWFFVSVGFDQLLHYAQLFITYQLLQ